MNKIIKTVDDAINRLNELQKKMVYEKSDTELLEILLNKDEWDEQYIGIVKSEMKIRNNR